MLTGSFSPRLKCSWLGKMVDSKNKMRYNALALTLALTKEL